MAGGPAEGDILHQGFVTPLVEAAEADEAAKKERAPATPLELLLFFLLLIAPAFFALVLLFIAEGPKFDYRQREIEPAGAKEPTTSTSPATPATGPPTPTTTTLIAVVQPPTEVIEGAPVPAPEPAPAPPPESHTPETAAPAPPHGG